MADKFNDNGATLSVRWSRDPGEVIISIEAEWEEDERILLDGSFNARDIISSIKDNSDIVDDTVTDRAVTRAHDLLTAFGYVLSRGDAKDILEFAFSDKPLNVMELEEALYSSGDYITSLYPEDISKLAEHLDKLGFKQ